MGTSHRSSGLFPKPASRPALPDSHRRFIALSQPGHLKGRCFALMQRDRSPLDDPAFAAVPDQPQTVRVRTVWISDLHLGTPGCNAKALLHFLKSMECEQLFLVGDIIDGWQLKRSWHWPQSHNDVVQKLLRIARKGSRVIFVPGNHDEFARRYAGHSFGGVEVAFDWVHQTADGRRLWITHGDLFDGVVQCAKLLAYAGDSLYGITLVINRHLNNLRARIGLPYWSLSKYLKTRVKRAVSYLCAFEEAVAREARRRGVDGVVCGHIHHAEIRDIGGVLYCNDGDWVESLTALVEHFDGRLEIIDWSKAKPDTRSPPGEPELAAELGYALPAMSR
jgi:UDP-2,3-diacylglucosamine pyrophosphatase LpxH